MIATSPSAEGSRHYDRSRSGGRMQGAATWSVLRRTFRGESLSHDLPVLHHERIRPELVAVVCRLGLPDDIGRVAINVLPQHLEGHSRLREFRDDRHEELPDRTRPTQYAVRGEQPRRGRVIRHDAVELTLPKASEVVRQHVLSRASHASFPLLVARA